MSRRRAVRQLGDATGRDQDRDVRQQGRLDRLEEVEREPRQDEGAEEAARLTLLARVGQQLDRQGSRVGQRLGQHRPEHQPAHGSGRLPPGGRHAWRQPRPRPEPGHEKRGDEGGDRDRQSERDSGAMSQQHQDPAEDQPRQGLGCHQPAEVLEVTEPGQDPSRAEREGVGHHRALEAPQQPPLALEQLAGDPLAGGQGGDHRRHHHACRDQQHLARGTPTTALGALSADDPTELLLHGQEQPRPHDEDQGPEGREGGEAHRTEHPSGQAQEQVGQDAGSEHPRPD